MTATRHRIVTTATAALLTGAALSALPRAGQAPGDRFQALARESLSAIDGDIRLPGLHAPVTVVRDRWGVPHITAQNTDDLFMAQGYVMAQDRLWQMEMWRRSREGHLAEILGPGAVARDRMARMLLYRGPMDDREWTSYHPDGKRIFTAYAAGVNAYIASHADNLPVEFKITGIKPDPWTAETVVLRSATMGDATSELRLARNVATMGVEAANKQAAPDPWDDLKVPAGLDVSIIDDAVAAVGRGGGAGGGAIRPALVEPYSSWLSARESILDRSIDDFPLGSNNWVVSGKLSATGKPVVANDPHREVTNPSLRYIVHLTAPGWNVIGSGEAPFVGVALGHNDRLGWGLTIVGTDQEDVYVEEVNPANPNEAKWRGAWEPIKIVREDIKVKGEAPRAIELKFTRHGPVFYEDAARHRDYVLRSALFEPGTASYLGGLRLAQAKDCRTFLDAAMYWKHATENLICGDVDGNISWQASALTPKRPNWSGRLPVPGTGEYEWDGFRTDLPREINPDRGFVATANNNVNLPGSTPVMYKTTNGLEFERITRLKEMVTSSGKYTLEDHRRMQMDAVHMRARSEIASFKNWTSANPAVERARQMLASWDAVLAKDSAAAALYSTWRTGSTVAERDQSRPIAERQGALEASLSRAITQLTNNQGADWNGWRWGRMHQRAFPHPFLSFFDLPDVERPGGSGSVAADGATYREILDVSDWDRSIVTNVPGQSGQPGSPFYSNLLPMWASDTYFPLVFSKARVASEAAHTMTLKPVAGASAQQSPSADQKAVAALLKGEDALRSRAYDAALDAFKQAHNLLNKNSAAALYGMARAYHGLGSLKNEVDACTDALKHASDDGKLESTLHNQRGLALVALAEKNEARYLQGAEADFRAVLGGAAPTLVAHYNLGVVLLKQNRDQDGIAELQAYVSAGGRAPEVANARAMIVNPRRGREPYAPLFKIASLEGEDIDLEALEGKVVVLDFWGMWCGPCVAAIPSVVEIHRKYAIKPVSFVGVSSDPPNSGGKLTAFAAARKMTWPEILDANRLIERLYDVHSFPTWIIVDAEGIMRDRIEAWGPNTRSDLERAIDRALKSLPR